ncbi:MAG: hypothetical protein KAX20_00745 [Candidatus Omnitrophica bacterium]|nr:hypothetical protein [Candidatus Omnitrophota bacterium]
MKEEELEAELIGLGKEFRKEASFTPLIHSTLKILEGSAAPSWRPSLRAIARQSPLLQFSEFTLSLLVLFALIRLFSFTSDSLLNITKVVSLALSFIMGTLFIFNPDLMSRIDRRLIGRLLNKGTIATLFQERILFRLQGLYFILIAFLICKL